MRPHVSINVGNVEKSVEFYKLFFGKTPQKQTGDYAKFDLQEPPLNFSLQIASPGGLSRVNHFGIEVGSPFELAQWLKRLELMGLKGKSEESVDCCYARQDKAWFKDPDGHSWEIFYVQEQLPVLGPVSAAGACCVPQESGNCCAT